MTEYEESIHAVVADPDNDEPRLRFAELIRRSDPDRATFIDLQIAWANEARARGETSRMNSRGKFTPLLDRHEQNWSRTLAKYTHEVRYDRGFVAWIRIDPYLFLEYGEFLYANAPITIVQFTSSEHGPVPYAELAASPLLQRLVAVSFDVPPAGLTQTNLEQILGSSHLGSLLNFHCVDKQAKANYGELAKMDTVRRLLYFDVGRPFPGQDYRPTGDSDLSGADLFSWTGLQPEGVALEARYGYLPWLHPNDNYVDPLDARWFVQHGKLPKHPVGTKAPGRTS